MRHDRELLRGVTVLETDGVVVPSGTPSGALYREAPPGPNQRIPLRLIPYYAWCNRGRSQMVVWIPIR
jgi:hypothetical protein